MNDSQNLLDKPSINEPSLPVVLEGLIVVIREEMKSRRKIAMWNVLARVVIYTPLLLGSIIMGLGMLHNWINEPQIASSVPEIIVRGTIAAGQPAAADRIIPLLRKVYEDPNSKGVILDIDSPGGSATEGAKIRDEMDRLHRLHPDKKVVAVGEGMIASAAYLIASGADKIYVQIPTITGSIGVIFEQFGLDKAMQRFGVEARVITAGAHKAQLSQYLPMDEGARARMQSILVHTHQMFIAYVKKGRGSKLKTDTDLFNGDFWSGDVAVDLGLADKVGTIQDAAKDNFGVNEVREMNHTAPPLLSFLFPQATLESVTPDFGVQAKLILQ